MVTRIAATDFVAFGVDNAPVKIPRGARLTGCKRLPGPGSGQVWEFGYQGDRCLRREFEFLRDTEPEADS